MKSSESRSLWQRLSRPFASRKVRIALATVAAAVLAELGLAVSEETVLAIIGVGISLILGIAHEDAARWSAGAKPAENPIQRQVMQK